MVVMVVMSVVKMNDIQLDEWGLVLCKSTEVTFCHCVRTGSRAHPLSCPMNHENLAPWKLVSRL